MEYKDVNDTVLRLHQTVNGQNIFVVLKTSPLDVRYGYDLNRKYEYYPLDLFTYSFLNMTEIEIGNIYDDLLNC